MSPKAVNYKANSIVYFRGDVNEKVFVLKSGRVVLKYNDIETGQEMQDLIQTGEFFGVKSALGKYPREETAVVLHDSSMVTFSVPEFEQVALKTPRIIMKMLQVFSTQLRRIHKQVRNLLSTGEQVSPEVGLFKIGEYYVKRKRYSEAHYAFQRYLTYYPGGKFASEAASGVQLCEKYVSLNASDSHEDVGPPPEMESKPKVAAEPGASSGRTMSDAAKAYYNAVSLFSQQKFQEALDEFTRIVNESQDKEYAMKGLFEVGRCLFSLENFDECIKHYTTMIQKYPKHPDLVDALYYVGSSHEKSGNSGKAQGFYKKILSMSSDDMPVHRKARKALRALGVD